METFKEIHRINLDGSFLIASKVASEIAKQNAAQTVTKDLSKPENVEGEEGGENRDKGVVILTSSVSATEGQVKAPLFPSDGASRPRKADEKKGRERVDGSIGIC